VIDSTNASPVISLLVITRLLLVQRPSAVLGTEVVQGAPKCFSQRYPQLADSPLSETQTRGPKIMNPSYGAVGLIPSQTAMSTGPPKQKKGLGRNKKKRRMMLTMRKSSITTSIGVTWQGWQG
jgi:hypothetical protein